MERMADKLNIYQKLIEVRKSCEYLKKDNQGYQFKFVSSSQTLGTLRAAMDEHNLLLVPSVTSHETRDHTTKKGDHEYFVIATMLFTWINADKPDERIECPWLGQGLDSGEKGVGKAMTYAEKYFLLKFFNIATDKDDPDSFQKKNESPAKVRKLTVAEEADNYNEMAGEVDKCTNAKTMATWFANNKARIEKLSDPNKTKLRLLYKQYADIFKADEEKT
jgi:hypothetical protein